MEICQELCITRSLFHQREGTVTELPYHSDNRLAGKIPSRNTQAVGNWNKADALFLQIALSDHEVIRKKLVKRA